jgi:hypothetical protein
VAARKGKNGPTAAKGPKVTKGANALKPKATKVTKAKAPKAKAPRPRVTIGGDKPSKIVKLKIPKGFDPAATANERGRAAVSKAVRFDVPGDNAASAATDGSGVTRRSASPRKRTAQQAPTSSGTCQSKRLKTG